MKTSFKELKTRNILSREQMQTVKGGGTCGFAVWTGDSYIIGCSTSKSEAIDMFNHFTGHGNWCCDSCGSTWYCGGGAGSGGGSGSGNLREFQTGIRTDW